MAASLTTPFGTSKDGTPVSLTTLTSERGLTVKFMSYGGVITEIIVPDRAGRLANVVLGFPTLEDYETKSAEGALFFGALIGRYANRIAKGRFTLGGREYSLPVNNPPNSLHGGVTGFDKRVWAVEAGDASGTGAGALLRLTSPDGDNGFPGTLDVTVSYTVADDNSLTIGYAATTDRDTVVNLTNHSYFNLAGAGAAGGIAGHVLTIDADRYTPTDHVAIPFGRHDPVADTPFDFRQPTPIGTHLRDDDQQLLWARGFDHNWVLNKRGDSAQPQFAARAYEPVSGRTLECFTTEPGVQVYTGNSITGAYAGNGGIYRQTDGFTLETQHFPDSPNQPGFPSTELKAGQTFRSTTIFRFGT